MMLPLRCVTSFVAVVVDWQKLFVAVSLWTVELMLQRCRNAWQAVASFSVLMRTVFQQAGSVMAMLTAMMDQMRLGVVSYLRTSCTICVREIAQQPESVGTATLFQQNVVISCYKLVPVLFPHALNISEFAQKCVCNAKILHSVGTMPQTLLGSLQC